MGQKKGNTGNPNGRPKGSKNQRTKEWEALGDSIITTHSQRFNEILERADDEQFARYFGMILEYFQPKLARTENNVTGEVKLKNVVIK